MDAISGQGRPLGKRRHSLRFTLLFGGIAAFTSLLAFVGWGQQEEAPLLVLGVLGGTLIIIMMVEGLLLARAYAHRRSVARVEGLLAEDATGCLICDPSGRILYRNRAARQLSQKGEDQAISDVLSSIVARPVEVFLRMQRSARRLGAAREDVVTRTGIMRLSVHVLYEGRYLWRFEGFSSQAPMARGADGISLPMLVAGPTGAVLFVNRAMRRVLGVRPRSVDSLFENENLERNSGSAVVIKGASGPLRVVVLDIAGSADRREIYLLPLTELPKFGANQQGFDDLPVALAHFASTGQLVHANSAASEVMGTQPDEVVNASDLFEGLGRPVREWIADVATGRHPVRSEIVTLSRFGTERFVQLTLRPLSDSSGEGVLAVLADATELKSLEVKFAQSQKMQAIGQLAGGVAHDFNNILTAISGHCDLLLMSRKPEDPDYSDLLQIRENSQRAADLVGQLLAFSRKQTLQMEPCSPNDALIGVTHLLRRLVSEKIQIDRVLQPDIGPVRADRRQLEQVVINLVLNARDAMPAGGRVGLETMTLTLPQDRYIGQALVSKGSYAVISVQDNGIGIPADKLSKIFEPFFTTKRVGEGTGLGLSMAYGIIKQFGGYIFCDSQEGVGTKFTIYLPLIADGAMAQSAEVSVTKAHDLERRGVILLVEDEHPVRAFAARALRLRGHEVLEADSGEAALEILSDPDLHIDAFVSDVIMPGLDGPGWVRLARQKRPEVPVIFVSGYAEDSFAGAQQDISASVFLAKPFSLKELLDVVQGQLP